MVKPEVIRRRLERLESYLTILRRLQRHELHSFVAEPEHYGSAERFLQLAIEATLDMGAHVVADDGLGSIEQSRDIPLRFREHDRIDDELARRWMRMIGFRNVLVHDYMEIDRTLVHEVLRNSLVDFEELARVFAAYL